MTVAAAWDPGAAVSLAFNCSCWPIGMLPGLTRIVLTAAPSKAGTDIAAVETTWAAPPRGWVSPSVACTAASAWAAVPDAATTNGSRCVTARPE